jgi:hypothetical protein
MSLSDLLATSAPATSSTDEKKKYNSFGPWAVATSHVESTTYLVSAIRQFSELPFRAPMCYLKFGKEASPETEVKLCAPDLLRLTTVQIRERLARASRATPPGFNGKVVLSGWVDEDNGRSSHHSPEATRLGFPRPNIAHTNRNNHRLRLLMPPEWDLFWNLTIVVTLSEKLPEDFLTSPTLINAKTRVQNQMRHAPGAHATGRLDTKAHLWVRKTDPQALQLCVAPFPNTWPDGRLCFADLCRPADYWPQETLTKGASLLEYLEFMAQSWAMSVWNNDLSRPGIRDVRSMIEAVPLSGSRLRIRREYQPWAVESPISLPATLRPYAKEINANLTHTPDGDY